MTHKQIEGFGGKYFISVEGKIFNSQNGKFRKVYIDRKGYHKIALWDSNTQTTQCLHRLIAQMYIPNPENLPQVNHKNGNKSDNSIENLEWCTCKENLNHSIYVLGNHIGHRRHNYKGAIHTEYGIFCTAQEAAGMCGISKRQMLRYLSGEKDNPTKFIWS